MTAKDEQIGRNLMHLRGDRPQTEIAEAMRERGYKWSQATVWAVEKGERPLRLTEADDLSRILTGVHDADRFLLASVATGLRSAYGRVSDAHRHFEKAAEAYLAALDSLAEMADVLSKADVTDEIPASMWETVGDWLEGHSPVIDAVEVERRHRDTVRGDTKDEATTGGVTTSGQIAVYLDTDAYTERVVDRMTGLADSYHAAFKDSGAREPKRRERENHGVDPEAS